jgi:hypothetical protein
VTSGCGKKRVRFPPAATPATLVQWTAKIPAPEVAPGFRQKFVIDKCICAHWVAAVCGGEANYTLSGNLASSALRPAPRRSVISGGG